jgi:hypothetical protein
MQNLLATVEQNKKVQVPTFKEHSTKDNLT